MVLESSQFVYTVILPFYAIIHFKHSWIVSGIYTEKHQVSWINAQRYQMLFFFASFQFADLINCRKNSFRIYSRKFLKIQNFNLLLSDHYVIQMKFYIGLPYCSPLTLQILGYFPRLCSISLVFSYFVIVSKTVFSGFWNLEFKWKFILFWRK